VASDNFNRANESPLASPWAAWGSWATCRLLSNAVQNSSGSDESSGMLYSTSNVADSQWTYTSGTTDGGPAIHCAAGPDGYFETAYDGSSRYIYRVDDGGFTYLGDVAGVYTAGQPNRLRRSGSNVIASKNGSDFLSVADTTYTGTTGSPGVFSYAGNLIQDSWTDGAGGTAYSLALAQGSYAVNGQAAGVKADRRITASQGSYSHNGQAVTLRMTRGVLSAEQGSYSLNGQAVTLTGPDVSYALTLDQGSYAITGSDAAVDLEINIDSGSYALTGNTLGLAYGPRLNADQGAYALNGQALGIRVTRNLVLAGGNYAVDGQDVGIEQHAPAPVLAMDTGFYTLTGNQVGLIGSAAGGSGGYGGLVMNWWTK